MNEAAPSQALDERDRQLIALLRSSTRPPAHLLAQPPLLAQRASAELHARRRVPLELYALGVLVLLSVASYVGVTFWGGPQSSTGQQVSTTSPAPSLDVREELDDVSPALCQASAWSTSLSQRPDWLMAEGVLPPDLQALVGLGLVSMEASP